MVDVDCGWQETLLTYLTLSRHSIMTDGHSEFAQWILTIFPDSSVRLKILLESGGGRRWR